jgi:DNA-binding response OmpR family regulator
MRRTPNILVIDDDAITLKVLSIVLNSEEVEVRSVNDPEVGRRMIKQESPRLVILDVFMPGKNGLDLLTEIRNDPDTQHTPVLMLTSDARLKGLAFDLGADGYLTKPFSPVELRQKISDLLHT